MAQLSPSVAGGLLGGLLIILNNEETKSAKGQKGSKASVC